MNTLVATLPVVVAVVAILLLRWSGLRAGIAGLCTAFAVVSVFNAFSLSAPAALSSVVSGLLNTAGVAYVLAGGVVLFHVLKSGGGLVILGDAVNSLIPDPRHRLLALVFGVSVFFESATGFGVGIIVTAPLYLAMGFTPLRSAALALTGQCAVPWGALAIGTELAAGLSGVPAVDIALWSAVMSYPFMVACGITALRIAQIPVTPGAVVLAMVYASVLGLAVSLGSWLIGIALAGCAAGLAVLGFAWILTRTGHFRASRRSVQAPVLTRRLIRAAAPFVFLVAALVVTRFVQPLKSWLSGHFVVSLDAFDFALALVYHPGFWLLTSALVGVVSLGLPRGSLIALGTAAAKQWWGAALAVAGFMAFGQLMVDSGMTHALADALADGFGDTIGVAIAVVGGLGGFLTASNVASNALFMSLQVSAAQAGGVPVELAVAAQNAAGSNMSFASPGRLVFAASVVGEPGAEGTLLRRIAPLALFGLASCAVILLLLLRVVSG